MQLTIVQPVDSFSELQRVILRNVHHLWFPRRDYLLSTDPEWNQELSRVRRVIAKKGTGKLWGDWEELVPGLFRELACMKAEADFAAHTTIHQRYRVVQPAMGVMMQTVDMHFMWKRCSCFTRRRVTVNIASLCRGDRLPLQLPCLQLTVDERLRGMIYRYYEVAGEVADGRLEYLKQRHEDRHCTCFRSGKYAMLPVATAA